MKYPFGSLPLILARSLFFFVSFIPDVRPKEIYAGTIELKIATGIPWEYVFAVS